MTQATDYFRVRITFSKQGAARFTGHLDLHRSWERTLRRAGAPVAYSEGFHPQPRMQFASALPLGYSSQAEIVDVDLSEPVDLTALRTELDRAVPPGMDVHHIEVIPYGPQGKKPAALQSLLRSANYTVTLKTPLPDLPTRLEAILTASELPTTRRDKTFNLRPRILTLTADSEQPDRIFHLEVTAAEHNAARPTDLFPHLGLDPLDAYFHRTALILAAPDA